MFSCSSRLIFNNCQQFAYAQTNHFTFVCQFTLQSDSMIIVIAFLFFFSYSINRYALCFSQNLFLALVLNLSTRATFRLLQSELTWRFSLIDGEWGYLIYDSAGTIHSIIWHLDGEQKTAIKMSKLHELKKQIFKSTVWMGENKQISNYICELPFADTFCICIASFWLIFYYLLKDFFGIETNSSNQNSIKRDLCHTFHFASHSVHIFTARMSDVKITIFIEMNTNCWAMFSEMRFFPKISQMFT